MFYYYIPESPRTFYTLRQAVEFGYTLFKAYNRFDIVLVHQNNGRQTRRIVGAMINGRYVPAV